MIETIHIVNARSQGLRSPTQPWEQIRRKGKRLSLKYFVRVIIFTLHCQGTMASHQVWTRNKKSDCMLRYPQVSKNTLFSIYHQVILAFFWTFDFSRTGSYKICPICLFVYVSIYLIDGISQNLSCLLFCMVIDIVKGKKGTKPNFWEMIFKGVKIWDEYRLIS